MKKSIALLLAVLAGLLVALAVQPAQASAAACKGYNYAGYATGGATPAVGSTASANVDFVSTLLLWGHIGGWVGVDNGGGSSGVWIQAGIAQEVTNFGIPYKYIEYQTSTGVYNKIPEGNATYGTSYNATVTHVSNGVWSATIGGSSPVQVTTGGTMNETAFTAESYDNLNGTSCNYFDIIFSSVSPWSTSSMGTTVSSPADWVSNVASNSWQSNQDICHQPPGCQRPQP